jgi:hypothetical protein
VCFFSPTKNHDAKIYPTLNLSLLRIKRILLSATKNFENTTNKIKNTDWQGNPQEK